VIAAQPQEINSDPAESKGWERVTFKKLSSKKDLSGQLGEKTLSLNVIYKFVVNIGSCLCHASCLRPEYYTLYLAQIVP